MIRASRGQYNLTRLFAPKLLFRLHTVLTSQYRLQDVVGPRPLRRQSERAKDSMGRAQRQKEEGQLITVQPTLHELPERP